MTTTIEAMKQAQHLLRWTHFGECRTYPGPVPEAREVDKLLTEAIAAEEAQWVEPVARVKRLTNCSIIDSTGCAVSWEDLPDGSALFTRPAPSPADHIGDATKLVRERAALIDSHKFVAENGVNQAMRDLARNTADMLAADAQQSAQLTEAVDANARLLVRMEGLKRAQQVAVPQGWKPMPTEPTKAMWKAAGDAVVALQQTSTLHHDKISDAVYRAMLAAAPQQPHGACDSPELCKLNGECSGQYGTKQKCTDSPTPPRAERVPMTPEQISDTYQKATGQHLRPCDKHAVETLTREIEAHHKIGVKP